MSEATENELSALRKVWANTHNYLWWQPKNPDSPFVRKMIELGFFERCDARFGFEKIRDAAIRWTAAGKAAMRAEPA